MWRWNCNSCTGIEMVTNILLFLTSTSVFFLVSVVSHYIGLNNSFKPFILKITIALKIFLTNLCQGVALKGKVKDPLMLPALLNYYDSTKTSAFGFTNVFFPSKFVHHLQTIWVILQFCTRHFYVEYSRLQIFIVKLESI